jgi:hypothetical protein
VLACRCAITLAALAVAVTDARAQVSASEPVAAFASTAASATYAVATAWTPVANRLYLLAATCTDGSDETDTPTVTETNGLDFVQVGSTALFNIVTAPGRTQGAYVWRAMKASGLSSGDVTLDFGGDNHTGCAAQIVEFSGVVTTGADGADAVIQVVSATADTTADPTLTLAGFGSGNGAYAFVAANTQTNATVEAGWTALSHPDFATPATGLTGMWRASSDTSPTFTLASSNWGMFGVEIADSGAAPTSTRRTLTGGGK